MRENKPPKGGWLGPPDTTRLSPIAVAKKSKKGKWVWSNKLLTPKEEKRHSKFQKAMKEADKDGIWRF